MQKTRQIRGVIHIHTACSRDGFLSTLEIADMCEAQGLSFAAITDHAEDMSPDSMTKLAAECSEHSRRDLLLIPGLEYRFAHGIHILVLGQREFVPPEPVIPSLQQLSNQGCMLIAAHCRNSRDIPDELLESLSAMEVWNIARDTKYFPTSTAIRAYFRCLSRKPDLLGIGGLDLHRGREWGCEILLDVSGIYEVSAVLSSLHQGKFITSGRLFSFSSKPSHTTDMFAFRIGDAVARIRDVRDAVEATFGVNAWHTKR